jgi:GNAT superfamily N-acetyltransferase
MQIRLFVRGDREQVASLVNAHVGAVVPGVSVSVQTLMSQLEREPGEYVVDPWVRERVTLVVERRGRVVAAAYLVRYGGEESVGEACRGAGEIRWLVCWTDAADAGDALVLACHAQFQRWGVVRRYADGSLPAPGIYGVPEQWPHVREIYERAGFRHDGRTEIVYLASIDRIERTAAPVTGLTVRRTVGVNGTRLSAMLDEETVGYIEVDANLDPGPRISRVGAWADVGNLFVEPDHRRRGVGRWLVGRAATWLELGGTTRLLDYAGEDEETYKAFLGAVGYSVLTRTVRGLTAYGKKA